jgi:hypothetical protein
MSCGRWTGCSTPIRRRGWCAYGCCSIRAPPPTATASANEYTLDASVVSSVEWQESAPDAQANEIKVEFTDRSRDYTKNTVTVRNVAAIQQLGRVESRTVSFIGVQSADIATRLGDARAPHGVHRGRACDDQVRPDWAIA